MGLTWTAATDNVRVACYTIFRGGTQVGTRTTTTFNDTAVVGGPTYSYTVSAFDTAGNVSAQSNALSWTQPTTFTPAPPTTPTGFTVKPV
jgi:chitodextrinase